MSFPISSLAQNFKWVEDNLRKKLKKSINSKKSVSLETHSCITLTRNVEMKII